MDPMRGAILWAAGNRTLREHLPNLGFVRATVRRFMPGESMDDALGAADALADEGFPTTFTYLGENVTTLGEADLVTDHYVQLLDRIAEGGRDTEISLKLTHLGLELAPEHAYRNLERLARHAAEKGNRVWIDMESTAFVQQTVDQYARLAADHRNTGICLQSYLKRTWDDVRRLLPLDPSIRLVKGAYREPPELAFQHHDVIDEAFLRIAAAIAERNGHGRLALATHDTDLLARIGAAGVAEDAFEVQMLYGIRVDQQRRLLDAGYRVRVLISYGDYWYPWFMRRMAEKPSNVWLAVRNLVARHPSSNDGPEEPGTRRG
jgi:proline dehydrogenase